MSPPRNRSNRNPYLSLPFTTPSDLNKSNLRVDKASVEWRDFVNSLKLRKRLIHQFKHVALDEGTPAPTLKRLLFEIRQLTLSVIEDALEIEYRGQLAGFKSLNKIGSASSLPPITSFECIKDKEDIFPIADMITDMNDISRIPSVKAFLPDDFPSIRNPFMLGKSVDELAILEVVPPKPGNVDDELKMLELLRYKRASNALLKAEIQVQNKLPLTLKDVERLWFRMYEDPNVDAVLRAVCTVVINCSNNNTIEEGTELRHIHSSTLHVEPQEFLEMLNSFKGDVEQLRIDIKAVLRQMLRNCSLDRMRDHSSAFLIEWLRVALGGDCFGDVPLSTDRAMKAQTNKSSSPNERQYTGNAIKRTSSASFSSTSKEAITGGANTSFLKIEDMISAPVMKRKKKQPSNDGDRQSTSTQLDKNKNNKNKNSSNNNNDNNSQDAPKKHDKEDLSVIRYELLKMQQELIRRKVLDPRHYKAGSIDAITSSVAAEHIQSLTKSHHGSNAKDMEEIGKSSLEEVFISKEIGWDGGGSGVLDITYEPLLEVLFGRLYRIHDESSVEQFPSCYVGQKEHIFTIRFSKLMVHRVTGHLLSSIVESQEPMRSANLVGIFAQIKSFLDMYLANGKVSDDGTKIVVPKVERTVYKCTMTASGVAVEVMVQRNVEGNGTTLVCRPLDGSSVKKSNNNQNNSPITLFLHDKELLVLMINQRGMYDMALSKWSSMEAVAQWLTSRLRVKRMPIFGNDYMRNDMPVKSKFVSIRHHKLSKSELDASGSSHMSNADLIKLNLPDVLPPNTMQKVAVEGGNVSHSHVLFDATAMSSTKNNEAKRMNSMRRLSSRKLSSVGSLELSFRKDTQSGDGGELTDYAAAGNEGSHDSDEPVLLDVALDRSVEIPVAALIQWKSRNVPNIFGADCVVEAIQELELLCFQISLVLPRHRPKVEGEHSYDEEFGDDDDDETSETASIGSRLQGHHSSITIPLSYRLTGYELLVFGGSDMIDEKKVSVATRSKNLHPSEFMWHILSRLQISFKVNY